MPPAVHVNGLSKLYRLGIRSRSESLREAISEFCSRPFAWLGESSTQSVAQQEAAEIWALRDVSFTVAPGEVVGIIGRNGAGKSTLLKILSRITHPTTGSVAISGSTASLLEVGTGFHPELTGRENIFLNGAILGMSVKTIKSHFDEIVTFSDIARFLDTPVKYFSSGMYVRLAFAVAAHLDIDTLIVDEVLAVGDAPFQKKCLAKLGDRTRTGRTVIFVSHNMLAVRQLCSRAILLDNGKIVADGPTLSVLREYNQRLKRLAVDQASLSERRFGGHSGAVRFTSFRVEDSVGAERYEFRAGESLYVAVSYEVFTRVTDLVLWFALQSEVSGEVLTAVRYTLSDLPLEPGIKSSARIELTRVPLLSHDFHPYVWLGSREGHPYDRLDYNVTNCPPITILSGPDDTKYPAGYFALESRLIRAAPSGV